MVKTLILIAIVIYVAYCYIKARKDIKIYRDVYKNLKTDAFIYEILDKMAPAMVADEVIWWIPINAFRLRTGVFLDARGRTIHNVFRLCWYIRYYRWFNKNFKAYK